MCVYSETPVQTQPGKNQPLTNATTAKDIYSVLAIMISPGQTLNCPQQKSQSKQVGIKYEHRST